MWLDLWINLAENKPKEFITGGCKTDDLLFLSQQTHYHKAFFTKPSYIRLSDCTVCWRCLGGIDTSAGLIQDGGGGHSRCSLYVSIRHHEWAAGVCQLVTDWNDSTLKSLFTYCKQYTLSFVFSKAHRYKQCPCPSQVVLLKDISVLQLLANVSYSLVKFTALISALSISSCSVLSANELAFIFCRYTQYACHSLAEKC